MLLQQFGLSQYAGFEFVGGMTAKPATDSSTVSLTSLTGGIDTHPSIGDLMVVGIITKSELSAITGFDSFSVAADSAVDTGYGGRLWAGVKVVGSEDDYVFAPNDGYWDVSIVGALVFRGSSDNFAGDAVVSASSQSSLISPATVSLDSANSAVIVVAGGTHDDGTQTYSENAAGGGRTSYANLYTRGAAVFPDISFAIGWFRAADTSETGERLQRTTSTPLEASERMQSISFGVRANL